MCSKLEIMIWIPNQAGACWNEDLKKDYCKVEGVLKFVVKLVGTHCTLASYF